MTEDDKKEILSSDEKGAAKSTLGGALAGAAVGTVVGTPVVGTLIGAVSGAVIAARKQPSKTEPTKRRTKAKTSATKKRAPTKAAAKKDKSTPKATDGDKNLERFNKKGHKVGIATRAPLRLCESAQNLSHPAKHAADALASVNCRRISKGIMPSTRRFRHHRCLLLIWGNDFASAEIGQMRTAWMKPSALPWARS